MAAALLKTALGAIALATVTLTNNVVADPVTSCLSQCYGISMNTSIEAVNWFCTNYADIPMPSNGLTVNYLYTPPCSDIDADPYWSEQGNIAFTMSQSQANVPAPCVNGMTPVFADCVDYLMEPINGCNSYRENHKQGGSYEDDCYYVEVNPNPNPCQVQSWQSVQEGPCS